MQTFSKYSRFLLVEQIYKVIFKNNLKDNNGSSYINFSLTYQNQLSVEIDKKNIYIKCILKHQSEQKDVLLFEGKVRSYKQIEDLSRVIDDKLEILNLKYPFSLNDNFGKFELTFDFD